jgi:hypothetical protein
MPTFQIGLEDGRKLRIEAESQEAALAGAQHFIASSAAQPKVGAVEDAVKSIPHGLMSGLAGVLSASGQGALAEMGQDPSDIPDAAQTQAILEKNVTGETHKPQTGAGRIAAGTASAVTNPTSYLGPAGPVRALLSSLAASAMSEGAGEATKDTAAELPARMIAGALAPTFAGKSKAPALPTAEELVNAGSAGFDAIRRDPTTIKGSVMENWAARQRSALARDNLDVETAPNAVGVLDRFTGSPYTTAQDLDKTRMMLRQAQANGGNDATVASRLLGELNDHISGLRPQDALVGDVNGLKQTWADAHGNYAAGMRAQGVDEALTRAQDKAAKANSGKNVGNAYRSEFDKYLSNERAQRGFNDAEVETIRGLVRGSPGINLLRNIGNRLGGGGGPGSTMIAGLGTAGGAAAGGPEGGLEGGGIGLGLAALGALARGRYNAGMASRAGQISNMVRARSPMALTMSAPPSAQNSAWIRRVLNTASAMKQWAQ